jgi:AraC-like DNA-binding protein
MPWVQAEPAKPLRQWLLGDYTGYVESSPDQVRRRELPFPGIPLIISFGDEIAVSGPGGVSSRPRLVSFLTGLSDGPAITEHGGAQAGIQINLTPLAAYRLLQMPMSELTNRAVGLDELLGRAGAEIGERLAELPSWPARFQLLDAELCRRLEEAPPVSPDTAWAYHELARRDGDMRIAELSLRLGCSRRHLASRFRREIGMTPKAFARVLRFHRVVRDVREGSDAGWAEAAADAGYYDQPHLNREFLTLAGVTPRGYREALLPGDAGVAP